MQPLQVLVPAQTASHVMLPPHSSETVPSHVGFIVASSQATALLRGVQPHWFGLPPAPQVLGPTHISGHSMSPQPSLAGPHALPSHAVAFGVHTQTLLTHAVWAAPEQFGSPHTTALPHSLRISPQSFPSGHAVVVEVHPHAFASDSMPPPHVCGAAQVSEQSTVEPQPSDTGPQATFWQALTASSGVHASFVPPEEDPPLLELETPPEELVLGAVPLDALRPDDEATLASASSPGATSSSIPQAAMDSAATTPATTNGTSSTRMGKR